METTETTVEVLTPKLAPGTARIGKRVVKLTAPASVSLLLDVAHLGARNWNRACAAALGICWHGAGRPKVSYKACGYDPAEYGGKVMDWLISKGISLNEVIAAGATAYVIVSDAVPDVGEKEVKETEDFSGAEGA